MSSAESKIRPTASWSSSLRRAPFVEMGRFMDAANALTLTGLAAALACVLLAMNQQLAYAIVALMISGLCDLFDGVVARRFNRSARQCEFGARLDTIVDACSFGIAPVVLLYASGLNHVSDILILLLFVSAAVWRLAYFDTVGLMTEGNVRYFSGLPTTYVALLLPIAYLPGVLDQSWQRGSLVMAAVGLALAMISTVPVRKPSGVFYVVLPTIGLMLASLIIVYADRFKK